MDANLEQYHLHGSLVPPVGGVVEGAEAFNVGLGGRVGVHLSVSQLKVLSYRYLPISA